MFNRCLITTVASLAILAAVQQYRVRTAQASPAPAPVPIESAAGGPEARRRRSCELDEQAQRRAGFAAYQERLLTALRDNQATLRDTTERVFYYCVQHYPEHLENVGHAEPAQHIKMKLAQNLVRALQVPCGAPPETPEWCSRAALGRLQQELQALPYEEPGTAPAV